MSSYTTKTPIFKAILTFIFFTIIPQNSPVWVPLNIKERANKKHLVWMKSRIQGVFYLTSDVLLLVYK